jgi:glucose/arabinose dehydrogenase
VQGVWEPKSDEGDQDKPNHPGQTVIIPSDLINFQGKGRYHAPQFTWNETVAPTDLTFLGTDKLGEEYNDDLFVATSSGKIYRFELNNDRTQLVLEASLNDRIAESSKPEDLEDIIFGQDFGVITDLEVGPDGNLYVLSYTDGTIYMIDES